ncbi:type II toxin-antitoxin system prevent-host-death family antitoxin [Candidatus Igneacidithiobacillus taiwanensis]|uniref:type II toxin-antitoxin system Phd/YefM family antitoxin n=1 Tax=Candidatus Igneacidithiobacillus taiwanensis TaxID=1945924 RepID=UPI0028A27CC1|nr:type II toxin-antitoxin system prevent-host-death family antitoxin [Candidatus Igneacidithiobacillus taiwanensis]
MLKVNMYEAKTQLSKLVERALAGETVLIAKAGVPVVRLVPTSIENRQRRPGLLEGKIRMAPDFDQSSEEILAEFENW